MVVIFKGKTMVWYGTLWVTFIRQDRVTDDEPRTLPHTVNTKYEMKQPWGSAY